VNTQPEPFRGVHINKTTLSWLLFSVVIILLDLWTKQIATESLTLYHPIELTSWLSLTLAHNYGAAFSFLSDAGGWQRWLFTSLAAVVTVILVIWLLRLAAKEKLTRAALSLVIGGAAGNLIDRIMNGYVVDFIDVYYRDSHWPAFNLADSAITLGVILLLVDGFFFASAAKSEEDD